MTDPDLDYLSECLLAAPFTPYPFDGEDRNLRAFNSKEELIEWYCQTPGAEGEPYRDRGFYCRELAMLSRLVQPRIVVEFGTSLGIGTCLLRWLNQEARLVTVDCNTETFLPSNDKVPMGYLAKFEWLKCEYVAMESWKYVAEGVDLCFVDADHSYWPVLKDSHRAYNNRSRDHLWAIAWHDYNERHPGVLRAVAEFCACEGLHLRSRPDSDTVWVIGEE